MKNLEPGEVIVGKVCPPCGRASIEYVNQAAKLVIDGKVKAMVTTPINKKAINLAAYGDIGHLDFLALRHDQVHIPIMVYNVEKNVSIALGLLFIRTSVDHGTAFDITGKGIADSCSPEETIKVAVTLSEKSELPAS